MNILKSLLLGATVFFMALLPIVGLSRLAMATDLLNNVQCGAELLPPGSVCEPPAGSASVADVATLVINILSWVVGILSVIMIIIAGFRYVTSGGKNESVTGAKNTILYAIVGLVIVALAQVIVRFVLSNVGNVSNTSF